MVVETGREMGRQVMRLNIGSHQDDFRDEMLTHNDIHGLLRPRLTGINNEQVYEYDIEGLVSLYQKCRRGLTASDLERLLCGIVQMVEESQQYLLREEDFVLDTETIFYDEAEGDMRFVCCPGFGQPLRRQLGKLAQECLNSVDYGDDEAVLIAYGFYMQSKEEDYSLSELLRPKRKVDDRPAQPVAVTSFEQEYREEVPTVLPFTKVPSQSEKTEEGQTPKGCMKKLPSALRMRIVLILTAAVVAVIALFSSGLLTNRATGRVYALAVPVVMTGSLAAVVFAIRAVLKTSKELTQSADICEEPDIVEDETILLMDDLVGPSVLIISDMFPTLEIKTFPYYVGKSRADCNFFIDAKGVSRKHFVIDRQGSDITITDLNSTNGTFVNQKKLPPNFPCTLNENDEIRFGGVSCYVNHLYVGKR